VRSIDQGRQEAVIIAGIIFEVRVLDQNEVAGGPFEAGPDRLTFSSRTVLMDDENSGTGPVGLDDLPCPVG
jgi:hypothetical protein